ncbi:MAG: hypothetical protein ABIQ95_03915 [Bdellovibrionia bacterium]
MTHILSSCPALAGIIELSGSFAFSSSNYGATGYRWKRSWEASVGYYLSDLTEIQISAEDIVDRTMLGNIEDTTFHDQIFSLEFVQSLLSKRFGFQPFVKAGVGQLLREGTGTYAGGVPPPFLMGSLTGILGGGLRIFINQQFSLKSEVTSYLRNGSISTWQDNFAVHFGFSYYF